MLYMGSKNRIAKDILPIILKDRKHGQWYVETMVGGGNLIDKVEGLRIGADLNPYVIQALKFIRDTPADFPDHISEEDYKKMRSLQFLDGVTGIAGFSMSFGGKWFGGYRRDKKGVADTANELAQTRRAKNLAMSQSVGLKGCLFINSSYQYLDIPPESIIYCDPPYEGTTGYKDAFSHEEFWDWVRVKSREGHKVFISEYNAPVDFDCVWSKEIPNALNINKKNVERLFTYSDLF